VLQEGWYKVPYDAWPCIFYRETAEVWCCADERAQSCICDVRGAMHFEAGECWAVGHCDVEQHLVADSLP
jgi:hypothetical protein